MTAKPKRRPSPKRQRADPDQVERFRQFAREHGADDGGDISDEAARKIIRSPPQTDR
jgi:hypothetical protein